MTTTHAFTKKYSRERSERPALSQEEITARVRKTAQGIYEARNREPGHELEDWLTAEQRVKKELGLL